MDRVSGRLLASAVALLLGLAGCGPTQSGAPQSVERGPTASGGSRRLRVVTTVLPMTLFTKAVGGSCAQVRQLLPPGTGPHDYRPRPGDLAALADAQVLVKNGLGLETFLTKVEEGTRHPSLQVIDASRGIRTLASADVHGAHDSGHAHETGHAHGDGHDHGPENPHVWLDPLRAVQQVSTIRDGLVAADPGCADGYRRNAAAFTDQLRQLDRQISAQLAPYRGKTFVAFHAVAPYFAERYGLAAAFLVDVPEANPSPADLQRVARLVKASDLQALLAEPQLGARSFKALAADLGIRVGVFDPLEIARDQAAVQPSLYVEVMRRNATELRRVFAGG